MFSQAIIHAGAFRDEGALILKNGNRFPRWSQQYGSFITVYDSRLKKDETVKEVVNAAGEAVNDPMNGRSDTIKNTNDTINGTINQRREGINEVYEGINEGINEGIKLVLELLNRNSGINAPQIAMLLGKGLSTIERTISEGIKMGVIEHRGSKKTGGYYAVK